MDLSDPAVIPGAILAAGGAIAGAIRWAVKRVVGAVDANTDETKSFGVALAAQRTELAVYAEAARSTADVLRALHTEVVKQGARLSTAMQLASGDTEPPPVKPGTPVRGIPVRATPPGGAYHVRKRTEGDG